MIEGLEGFDVVLATNGTNPQAVIDVIDHLNVVNVSIHGEQSYDGYLEICKHANGTKVISSAVEGEPFYVTDRVYKRHTVNGIWGKVEGIEKKEGSPICKKMEESIFTWEGEVAKCCHVWDLSIPIGCDEGSACLKCDQWMGNGKTL